MNRDERVQLGVEVSPELKRMVDADRRTNRQAVEAALWAEYGGGGEMPADVRIQEKEKRIGLLTKEKGEREKEIEELREQISALEERKEEQERLVESVLTDAAEVISPEQLQPDNAAVKNWADKADMKPETFIEEIRPYLEDNGG